MFIFLPIFLSLSEVMEVQSSEVQSHSWCILELKEEQDTAVLRRFSTSAREKIVTLQATRQDGE